MVQVPETMHFGSQQPDLRALFVGGFFFEAAREGSFEVVAGFFDDVGGDEGESFADYFQGGDARGRFDFAALAKDGLKVVEVGYSAGLLFAGFGFTVTADEVAACLEGEDGVVSLK